MKDDTKLWHACIFQAKFTFSIWVANRTTFCFFVQKNATQGSRKGDKGRSFRVPSTKIQRKRQTEVRTAHRWCQEPHGFLYSWKMVSNESRTWGQPRLAEYQVHYSLQSECHWVILVIEFLFLQGPHLASNSLSQYCPPLPFLKKKKHCLFIVRLLCKKNRQRWRGWVGGQGPRGELSRREGRAALPQNTQTLKSLLTEGLFFF